MEMNKKNQAADHRLSIYLPRPLKKLLLVVLLTILVIVTCRLLYPVLEKQGQQIAAPEIEAALRRDCQLELSVDPDSVETYELALWTTVYQTEGRTVHITCFVRNQGWECDCGPLSR